STRKAKGPATVRLRFHKEVWDVTLQEPGCELSVDLFTHYTSDINYRAGEDPHAELYLWLIKGEAEVKVESYLESRGLEAPPGSAMLMWNNSQGTPQVLHMREAPKAWDKEPP